MNNVAVALSNVGKTYNNVTVVDNSLLIEEGEIFGLLGTNGAGKSTTIRMSIALAQPDRGTIEVAGYDVTHHPNLVKKSIGVVLQQISVDGELSVWENLEFHGRMHHIANAERQQKINTWLKYVDLSDRRDSLVKTLSGLGTLEEFREKYGKAIALKQTADKLESKFFPDSIAANNYLNSLKDKTGITIRDSNLEDIFVELTGHQLS